MHVGEGITGWVAETKKAVAIGKLGGWVAWVGCLGEDENGARLERSLIQAGVSTQLATRTHEAASGVALILVEDSGQNAIAVVPGSNLLLRSADVHSALQQNDSRVVLVQFEGSDESIVAAVRSGRFVIVNPAPARAVSDLELAGIDLITPNEIEAEALTGVLPTNPEETREAAHRLLDQGVRAVVITLGEKGCFYCSEAMELHVPALAVQVVDTTAAGDAFNGALAHFLACGREIENALRLGVCVASLSTTRAGAQTSAPTAEEVRSVAGEYW